MRIPKYAFAILLLSSAGIRSAEWSLPSANQGAWVPGTNVGVPGGIAQYIAGGVNDRAVTGNVINVVTHHSADNTGVSDVKTAVEEAISAASAGDVIYFPAGTYLFASNGIYIPANKANITIRGAGVGVTTFHMSTNGQVFVWPDPGYIPGDILTVTGTKTKGTSTLTVSSSTGYDDDEIAFVRFENETDNTRIQNGAAPVWSSLGYPWARTMLVRVTGTTGTTISIDPPLPADFTNLTTQIHTNGLGSTNKVVGWGFEDFSVTFDNADHPTQVFTVTAAQYNWFYNVHFEDFSRPAVSANGSCIRMQYAYRCEIRKCRFDAEPGSGSDGAIETGTNSSCLIEDNIFNGPFGEMIYESGNSVNNVISYNYGNTGLLTIFHNRHPSLNIAEGNAGFGHHSDGYHGSSSHNTIYRNWYRGPFQLTLNRFKRNYVAAGNIFGADGSQAAALSFGNPNISNGAADGFAGPTGLSNQVGQTDYSQPGYGLNEYVIQAGDVAVGDFWEDWEITGTLTTRTSDTVGAFTVAGGNWLTGASPTGGAPLVVGVHWNSKASNIVNGTVTNVAGNLVTISFGGGSLPDAETAVQMYTGPAGSQERDLDVLASTTLAENYHASAGGTGSVQSGVVDTLPDSLVHSAKPAWFGNLPWPPFDPNSPVFDVTRIPAGYRYTNGNENYLTGDNTPTYRPGRLRLLRR